MIVEWLMGFGVVTVALGILGAIVGFVRGLLPVRPYPDYAVIERLDAELLDE